MKDRGSKE